MDDEVFFEINGRNLYLDSYLVDFDIPIFYICKDDEYEKYAIMCINSHTDEYIVVKTSNKEIKAMLENKLSLYDFMSTPKLKWHITYDKSSRSDNVEFLKSIDKTCLPKKNEFLELYNKRITKYLERINQEILTNDLELEIERLFKKYNFEETVKKEIYVSVAQSFSVVSSLEGYYSCFISNGIDIFNYTKNAFVDMKRTCVRIPEYTPCQVKLFELTC